MSEEPVFIVGFTGSRHGMNAWQKGHVKERLGGWFRKGAEFHFGDCVGGDKEAFEMASAIGYWTVAHPPTIDTMRAFCSANLVLPPQPYFLGNGGTNHKLVAFAKAFALRRPTQGEELEEAPLVSLALAADPGEGKMDGVDIVEMGRRWQKAWTRHRPNTNNSVGDSFGLLTDEIERLRLDKDGAYLERNQLVALLASIYPSGIARTDIPGWLPEWHGCVYMDLPNGQASWHYHDSHAHLFEHLPPYTKPWDGHNTAEKYQRIVDLAGVCPEEEGLTAERDGCGSEQRERVVTSSPSPTPVQEGGREEALEWAAKIVEGRKEGHYRHWVFWPGNRADDDDVVVFADDAAKAIRCGRLLPSGRPQEPTDTALLRDRLEALEAILKKFVDLDDCEAHIEDAFERLLPEALAALKSSSVPRVRG